MSSGSPLREVTPQATIFRLGSRPQPSGENQLVAADQIGRDAAAARVATRLNGFHVSEVTQRPDTKVPLLLQVSPQFIGELAAGETVDTCIRSMNAQTGHIRLADGSGRPHIPAEDDVFVLRNAEASLNEVRPFAAVEALHSGATIIVNNLVQRVGGELRDTVNDLARCLGAPPQVNLYLSEREALGFGRHWDDHDVIVLQCSGRKHWSIFAPTVLSPRLGVTPLKEFGDAVFSGVLEPGLALFIPRGGGHEVSGFKGETSLHYTIGLRPPNGCDVLAEVRAAQEPTDRERLATLWRGSPNFLGIGRAQIEHAIGAYRQRFMTTAANGVSEVDQAVQRGFHGCSFTAPFPGGLVFADYPDRDDEAIAVVAGGSTFEFDEGSVAVDVIETLLAGNSVDIADDATAADPTLMSALALARRGVAELVSQLSDAA